MARSHAVVAVLVVIAASCSSGGGGSTPPARDPTPPADTTPPQVIVLAPADGATGVAPGASIDATFDEAIDPASVTTASFGVEAAGQPVAGATSAAGRVARFVPAAPLPELTTVTVRLGTGIRDLAGNPLAAVRTWSFTIGDVTPPQVLGVAPGDGAADVDPRAIVTVEFSEAVAAQAAAAVSLSPEGGAPVTATAAVSGARVTLAPAAPLAWGTRYVVRVGAVATDLSGNPLPAPFASSFRTAEQPGSLDASFAASGALRLDLGGRDTARALAIRASDGRIAVGAATDAAPYGARVVRLTAAGEPDPAFGTTGVVNLAPFSCASGVGFQSTGRLVAAVTEQTATASTFITVRLDEAGALDSSFGAGGGVARPDVGTAFNACSTHVAIQPDDRIVLAGQATTTTGLIKPILRVVRLTADGALDPSFGTTGVATLDLADARSTAWDVVLQPDGKIVVAGWSYWDAEAVYDAIVWRLGADGTPDPSFGDGGLVRVHAGPAGSNDRAVGVGVDGVGRIVVALDVYAAGVYRSAAARLDASGALDASFGGGIVSTFDGPGWAGVAVQPDGKAVLAGELAAMRLGTDGALDGSFGAAGVAPLPAGPFESLAIRLQPDGMIVVAGETWSAGQPDVGVVRLRP